MKQSLVSVNQSKLDQLMDLVGEIVMFTEFSMAWMTSSTDPVGLKSMIRPFLMISEQRVKHNGY